LITHLIRSANTNEQITLVVPCERRKRFIRPAV
jgi:hypothetical protein